MNSATKDSRTLLQSVDIEIGCKSLYVVGVCFLGIATKVSNFQILGHLVVVRLVLYIFVNGKIRAVLFRSASLAGMSPGTTLFGFL